MILTVKVIVPLVVVAGDMRELTAISNAKMTVDQNANKTLWTVCRLWETHREMLWTVGKE